MVYFLTWLNQLSSYFLLHATPKRGYTLLDVGYNIRENMIQLISVFIPNISHTKMLLILIGFGSFRLWGSGTPEH